MATEFPNNFDVFPTLVDNVDDILAVHQNNRADAIEALESKVGVTSSPTTTSHDYLLRNLPAQDGSVIISNLNAALLGGAAKDADGTLAGNSDSSIPTEKAVKTYVDAHKDDIADAHDASAISVVDEFVHSSSTNVQDVLDDVDVALTSHQNDDVDSTNIVHGIRQGAGNGFDADKLDGAHKDIDETLSGNSDLSIPTEKAVKTYVDALGTASLVDTGTTAGEVPLNSDLDLVTYVPPNMYDRSRMWTISNNTTARTSIVSPAYLAIDVNRKLLHIDVSITLDVGVSGSWDTTSPTDYTVADTRAGKDFYIYACEPAEGNAPVLKLSANSTIPTGYTADTSRKIGGFHCLCAAIGTNTYGYVNSVDDIALVDESYVSHTISGTQHWLEGYVAGDVLPFSIWDLLHRPASSPEGMVYDPGSDKWIDIYLANESSGVLQSVNGGTIADGSNGWHQYRFSQMFGRQKKLLPRQDEFVSFSLGSPQGVNISGSADPGTTGGHSATDGKRIVSLIGVEDAAGVLWQWGREAGATTDVGSSWANAYDGNDSNVAGEHYEAPNRPRFGGAWNDGAICGSRGSIWLSPALFLPSNGGGRGVAEPLGCRS